MLIILIKIVVFSANWIKLSLQIIIIMYTRTSKYSSSNSKEIITIIIRSNSSRSNSKSLTKVITKTRVIINKRTVFILNFSKIITFSNNISNNNSNNSTLSSLFSNLRLRVIRIIIITIAIIIIIMGIISLRSNSNSNLINRYSSCVRKISIIMCRLILLLISI